MVIYQTRFGYRMLVSRIKQSRMCPLEVDVFRGNISPMLESVKNDVFPARFWWTGTESE